MRRGLVAAAILMVVVGCRTAPITPTPPSTPTAQPPLERTFGDVRIASDGGFSISYKDLLLAVDPSSRSLSAMAPQLDFLLITGAVPYGWPADVRRDLKIIATSDTGAAARKAGFPNAKTLASGQRLMLSKTGVFLFVSAVQTRIPSTGIAVNGYLLEFDNGRNIFIAGGLADLAPLREFVYGLRDDGKQLQLAFVGAAKSDEPVAAEAAALLGSQVAVFIDRGGLDRSKLQEAFTNQIYDGQWHVASPSETVPF